ncbi:MAG: hypothetical protein AAF532_11665 [Planctomycetota bacterium]
MGEHMNESRASADVDLTLTQGTTVAVLSQIGPDFVVLRDRIDLVRNKPCTVTASVDGVETRWECWLHRDVDQADGEVPLVFWRHTTEPQHDSKPNTTRSTREGVRPRGPSVRHPFAANQLALFPECVDLPLALA